MSAAAQPSASQHPLVDFHVPQAEITALLKGLKIHLDTALAPTHILAATDTLLAIELAAASEPPYALGPALALLQTWRQPQPEPIRLTQQAVIQAAPADSLPPAARSYLLDELSRLPQS